MNDIMGWTLALIGFVINYFMIKDIIKSYHYMKESKRKAEMWGARF